MNASWLVVWLDLAWAYVYMLCSFSWILLGSNIQPYKLSRVRKRTLKKSYHIPKTDFDPGVKSKADA